MRYCYAQHLVVKFGSFRRLSKRPSSYDDDDDYDDDGDVVDDVDEDYQQPVSHSLSQSSLVFVYSKLQLLAISDQTLS